MAPRRCRPGQTPRAENSPKIRGLAGQDGFERKDEYESGGKAASPMVNIGLTTRAGEVTPHVVVNSTLTTTYR